jgi:hypothetical protein
MKTNSRPSSADGLHHSVVEILGQFVSRGHEDDQCADHGEEADEAVDGVLGDRECPLHRFGQRLRGLVRHGQDANAPVAPTWAGCRPRPAGDVADEVAGPGDHHVETVCPADVPDPSRSGL